jgi:hypothetical protein
VRPANAKNNIATYARPLISSALIAGGLLQLAAPIYAAGTTAGADISNTATASYEDPTGATLNTTSNTVSVKVSEVAGITITAGTVTNVGSTAAVGTALVATGVLTAPAANDKLVFEFDLTNIGNDTTSFKVPNQAQVGNSPVTVNEVQYYDFATTSWKPVNDVANIIAKNSTDGGDILPTGITGNPGNTKSIVKVRVLATVNAGTTSGEINVTLGNTGQTNLQNAPFAATGGDVYTVDILDGVITGETAGVPSNGEREAAATAVSAVNPVKQAFVAVKKTAGTVADKGTPAITDDEVTYKLSMDVAATAPTGTNKEAEALAGTAIKLDGNTVNKVLVADSIPVGTKLVAAPAPTDTTWTVVYTDAAVGTTAANDSSVMWKTFVQGTTDVNTVTRIGYVKNGPIAKGTKFDDFAQLTVVFSGIPASGASVLNIAQAFGTTVDANGNPDITKPAVDESGDAQYNNLNSDGTPGPTPTNGVATSADGVDTLGTNAGSGSGGEGTIVTVTPAGQATGLTNGPLNKPDATGPSGGKNDDFTNKSVTIDITQAKWTNGIPNAVDPQSLGFTNTVKSTGGTRPEFVSLLPTAPANPSDLPNGTTVKVVGTGGAFVEYIYNNGAFAPKVANTLPLTLTVPVGGSVNYGVEIDLPAGTPQIKGFPVSITAFANGKPEVLADPNTGLGALAAIAGDNVIDPTDAQNITIDRVYTGYVKLLKEAQVSKIVNGVTSIVYPFAASVPKAEPGQFIEYRIKYTNISEEVPTNSGSIGLAANNIKIVEDGNIGGNNWASLTEHKPDSAKDDLGTIVYEGGAKTPGDLIINDYLDTIPKIDPTKFGEFTFTRQVK